MAERIDVFISSTSIDLPEHRQAVKDALLAIGLFPSGMETWPVEDENPVDLCRTKLEKAKVYIGIYAHRYGWRPDGPGTKSITEMEYDWAEELGIPRFCFVMDDDHPWPIAKMELEAKDDLDAFKARVKERIVGFFTTPDNLRAQVAEALTPYARKQDYVTTTRPYLKQLHYQSMQSGLLRTLDPSSKDPASAGKQITVDQVYTPLDVQTQVMRDKEDIIRWDWTADPDEHRDEIKDDYDRTSPLSALEAANHYQNLVILGDPGSGKSTFVNFLALCMAGHLIDQDAGWLDRLTKERWTHQGLLPVHVTLRDFAQDMGDESIHGTVQSLLHYLENLMMKYGCPEAMQAIQGSMNDGTALLILDGLDEVPTEKREAVRDAVIAVMQAFDECHLLITCRILSYTNSAWQIPNTAVVTLAPFDMDKTRHFVEAWYTASMLRGGTDEVTARARIADLTEAIQDRRLEEMATNPMLLTVMAIVHDHQGRLPRETANLYHECVELLMLRWRPHDARALKDELGVQDNDLRTALWRLAYEAHEGQSERTGTADISEADIVYILEESLGGLENAQKFCHYVEERAGLLFGRGVDEKGVRIYTFPHRTFQEYLAGCHIATNSRNFNRMIREKARQGEKWRQVILLATGQTVFVHNDTDQPIDAVLYLLSHEPENEHDWRAVWVAGDMLTLIGLRRIMLDDTGKEQVLPEARQQLAALVSSGPLDIIERAAAGRTLATLGDPRPGVGVKNSLPDIDWARIRDGDSISHEVAQRFESTFYMARYPVTYAQYQTFVEATDGFKKYRWWAGLALRQNEPGEQYLKFENHPADNVSWYDAVAFCRWLTAQAKLHPEIVPTAVHYRVASGKWVLRLPTVSQYERAARGINTKANPHRMKGVQNVTAVGIFPEGPPQRASWTWVATCRSGA